MSETGIRELKQNASAVVARAAAGEIVTVTDRGRPVAQLTPLPTDVVAGLVNAGLARAPKRSIAELPPPRPGGDLSRALEDLRAAERY